MSGPFGDCSARCEGTQTRVVTCRCNATDGSVIDSFDSDCVRDHFPSKPTTMRSCGPECQYGWDLGAWGVCDKVCGSGTQTRSVSCREQTTDTIVADSFCDSISLKPPTQQICDSDCQYITGSWGACSVSCGGGQQTRSVTCLRTEMDGSTTTLRLRDCEEDSTLGSVPSDTQDCNTDPCGKIAVVVVPVRYCAGLVKY